MNILYSRILNLVVSHGYFEDAIDKLIYLIPTKETEALLKNGKMLFKYLPNGITVLYRTLDDESTPFVELGKDQRFTFAIKFRENKSGLLNITDLDESPSRTYSAGNILYFTNTPASASTNRSNPETLSQEIIDTIRSPLFTYQFTLSGNPSTVKMVVADAEGNPVSVGKDTEGVPFPTTLSLSINDNNAFEQQVDLRPYSKGRYMITILNDAETDTLKEEEIYVDEDLAREDILGVVDLVYETATDHLYGDTEEYKLELQRAESHWKYYIVNKSENIDLTADSLLITDAGSINGTPYIVNDFPRAYSSILLTAKSSGAAGNSIALAYSGGAHTAAALSGETLSGGATGVEAEGRITIINNSVTGYTISIGGIDFVESTDFSNGATPADTAANLIAAINGNGSVLVTAAALEYDIMISDFKTLVFSSKQTIPFYEQPKLKIELKKTSDNQTIIGNLPNPSREGLMKQFADRLESEVYVFI